jgi:transglutaminase-like putative cysteine protease
MKLSPKTSPGPIVKNKRWFDPFSAVLLLAAVLTASTRLLETDWTPELRIVRILVIPASLLGLALGYSRYPRWLAAGFGLAYGVLLIPWQLATLSGTRIPWAERLGYIGTRLTNLYIQISSKDTLTDSLLFVIMMALLFWSMCLYAGFSMTRSGASWRSIFPIGLTMFVVHYYHNCPYSPDFTVCRDATLLSDAWYLAVFVFFVLLLIARVFYLRRVWDWEVQRVYVAPEAGYDLLRSAVLATILVMIASWVVPAAQASPLPAARDLWDAAGSPIRTLNDRLRPWFESVTQPITVPTDDFGKELALGMGLNPSNRVALSVIVPLSAESSIPFYWRNRVYDEYIGGQWNSTFEGEFEAAVGNFNLPEANHTRGSGHDLQFTSNSALNYLYTPSRPVGSSEGVVLELVENADGTSDLGAVRATAILKPKKSYQVRTEIPYLTSDDLLKAGEAYPDWVLERYLQLPDTITPRTIELAQEITVGLETPFEKASAVTQYLRNSIEYLEVIDASPEGQDIVDWFLFDYKKGFCNYYATAEVILLRSLGVPARLVAGYAEGQRQLMADPQTGQSALAGYANYVVTGRDAHAWPEVYFPGIGWVEFEPTVSRRAIERPNRGQPLDLSLTLRPTPVIDFEATAEAFEPKVTPTPQASWLAQMNRTLRLPWLRFLLISLPLLLLAALIIWQVPLLVKLESWWRRLGKEPPAWLLRWRKKAQVPFLVRLDAFAQRAGLRLPAFMQSWVIWAGLSPVARAYTEINRTLQRLGHPAQAYETPSERAARLTELLPPAENPTRRLLTEYHVDAYSTQSADVQAARKAAQQIRKITHKAWVEGFFSFVFTKNS